jgi:hypothetical protein
MNGLHLTIIAFIVDSFVLHTYQALLRSVIDTSYSLLKETKREEFLTLLMSTFQGIFQKYIKDRTY